MLTHNHRRGFCASAHFSGGGGGSGNQNPSMGSRWVGVVFALSAFGGLAYVQQVVKHRRKSEVSGFREIAATGEPLIGGDFELTDIDGKRVSLSGDYAGKWTILYFGFTHCAEICPEELKKLTTVITKLKKMRREELAPLFITVDPKRDSPERMREYSKGYHPSIRYLYGTNDEIREVTRKFRVYYMEPPEDTNDYQVDHSIYFYLMNPEGKLAAYMGKDLSHQEVMKKIIEEFDRQRAKQ